MQGKQCQLQAIGHTGLIEDGSKVVLDYLLGVVEFFRDALVLVALYHQPDDLQFFPRKPIPRSLAYQVGVKMFGWALGCRLYIFLAATNRSQASENLNSTYIPVYDPVDIVPDVRLWTLELVKHGHQPDIRGPGLLAKLGQGRREGTRKDNNGAVGCFHSLVQASQVVTLANNSEVFFDYKKAGNASSEHVMVVRDDDS